ncbi:hypothetical protein [Microvirga arabica]|nr:hypothetical protein [Microvirga arabica]
MTHYAGPDVPQKETTICIVDEQDHPRFCGAVASCVEIRVARSPA